MFQADLLQDKVILVTGGGTGLGRAMGERFLELGAKLAICGRRQEVAEQAAADMARRSHAMRNELDCWLGTRLLEPKRSGGVYTLVEVFSPERRGSERSRTYVAPKSDLIILPRFVLSQIERPGRALAGRTAGCLHLQYLRGWLSTSHAKRAREAASPPSLRNASSSCFPTPQSDQVGSQRLEGRRTA
jgi:hypothetical protein